MRLRPHHLVDIVTSFGHGQEFRPHPYGHSLHTVAEAVLADADVEVEFVVQADDVCRPCKHLTPEGLCDDIRVNRPAPLSKQEYNDDLDRRLLAHLHMDEGVRMTAREFLRLVKADIPGVVAVFTQDEKVRCSRLLGLTEGLRKLGLD
jgi:hypothetical protein